MTSWTIPVPYKSLSDSLSQVGANARALENPEDRAVVHQLVLLATCVPGATDALTAGDLIAIVKSIPAGGRRKALDVLRQKAGLPTTVEVERKAMLDSTSSAYTIVSPDMRPIPTCAFDGCGAIARDPVTLQPSVVDVTRWFCETHRDQAEPGDMDPPPSGWRFAQSGAIEQVTDGPSAPSAGAGWTA